MHVSKSQLAVLLPGAGALALALLLAAAAAPLVAVAGGVLLAYVARSHATPAAAGVAVPMLVALLAAEHPPLTKAALVVLTAAAAFGAWRYAQRSPEQCPVLGVTSFEALALTPTAALLFSATSLLNPHVALSAGSLYLIAVLGSAALQQRHRPWSRLAKAFVTVAVLLAGAVAGARPGSEQLVAALSLLMIGAAAMALLVRNDLALYVSMFVLVLVAAGAESPLAALAAVTGACIALAHARIAYLRTITSALRRKLAQVRANAERDELTGALNRRGFFATASAALSLARRTQRPCTLFVFDLDGFKALNDRFGHARGDAFLKAMAAELGRNLRASDVFGRLGGDEFAILGVDAEEAGERAIVKKVVAACASASTDAPVGASIGSVRVNDASVANLDALLAQADAAMYEAKLARKRQLGSQPQRTIPTEAAR